MTDIVYLVEFEPNSYQVFTSTDAIYKYIDNNCGFISDDIVIHSAYNFELNDYTIPQLVSGKWHTEYMEDCSDEVVSLVQQVQREYADAALIVADEKFYY